jgi:hypothetical protein
LDRRRFLDAFESRVAPELRRRGFDGAEGHFVRRRDDVTQVVELQLSIYGFRVTANLGLDLAWLEPAVRWVHPPKIGPHAHEAVRWVRLGIAGSTGRDHWWSFEDEENLALALAELESEILLSGVQWLERESDRSAFLRDAEARVDRSKGPRHPEGRFAELRLLAAVLAWNGRVDEARRAAEHARACWDEERQKLSKALTHFSNRYPSSDGRAPTVPDLARELDRLISPTTGVFAKEPAEGRPSSLPSEPQ